MSDEPPRPLLAFYGDDFTGSTDVMESLAKAGIRTALFLDPPGPADLLGRFAGLEAVGVAGTSRSMTPVQMDEELPPVFEALGRLNPSLVHYKICSTFDSSPEVGSIGRALDIGQRVFDSPFVALVVGAPILKRYCVFGNLFATVGAVTHRLDRHPTMSRHPVTPMDEADLTLHLARQTDRPIGLMDVLHLSGEPIEVNERFAMLLGSGAEVVLFDVLDDRHLAEVGRLIWTNRIDRPLFAVGSSGLEYALVAHWRAAGTLGAPEPIRPAGPVDRLVVASGSCSPTTRDQVRWALEHGFARVEVDAAALADPEREESERAAAVRRVVEALPDAAGVVVDTALGPDDPRIAAALDWCRARGIPAGAARDRLGAALGQILRDVLEAAGLRRAMVTGGDTSGHAACRLGIDALEFVMPLAPGSPLCRATSRRESIDGLEIVLKGGQVGQADFFGRVLRGDLG